MKQVELQEDGHRVTRLKCSSSSSSSSTTKCNYIYYDNPLPVVAAIVEKEPGKIVMVQNKGWDTKWFGLVTGFLERTDESPEAGVLREVKEEIGLDCEVVRLIGVHTFEPMNQLMITYHLRPKSPSQPIELNREELEDYKLVPFDEVKTWPFGTGIALREFLASQQQQQKQQKPTSLNDKQQLKSKL